MFDSYLNLDPAQPEAEALNALDTEPSSHAPNRKRAKPNNSGHYSKGELDGQINLDLSHPEDGDSWSGYGQGNREYWCEKKGRELVDEFKTCRSK